MGLTMPDEIRNHIPRVYVVEDPATVQPEEDATMSLPKILVKKQLCKKCGKELKDRSPLSYAENPFCGACLKEGMKLPNGMKVQAVRPMGSEYVFFTLVEDPERSGEKEAR